MVTVTSLHDHRVATAFADGAVAVIPTDTIYGLAADVHHRAAVEKLYGLKDREHKPGTVIAANVDQLLELGLPVEQIQQVAHLWPNPISIVLPAPSSLDYLDQDVGSLAVRIPDDPEVRALLEMTGPLLTTSANHPGQQPATNTAEAHAYFGDTVDLYVDGGDRVGRPASTVVRLEKDGQLTVLRQGAVIVDPEGKLA